MSSEPLCLGREYLKLSKFEKKKKEGDGVEGVYVFMSGEGVWGGREVRGREARGAGGGRGWGLKRRRAYSLHKESIGCISPATTASVPLCKFNRGRELTKRGSAARSLFACF